MRALGYYYEKQATEWLKKRDYTIIKQNYYCLYGEIDIIALKNNIMHFIEVKGSKNNYISVAYKINKKKKEKIIMSALDYISKNNVSLQLRFDLIEIKKTYIYMHENIININ